MARAPLARSVSKLTAGRSNRFVISLAMGLGLIGAILVVLAVRQAGSGDSSAGAKVPVVVAVQDIPARERVSLEMLTVEQMPEGSRHAEAFATIAEVEGQVTAFPIVAGEQVLSSRLASRTALAAQGQQSGLAFVVPPGMRSMSITVTEVIGSGGLIVPGDFVDVQLIRDMQVSTDIADRFIEFEFPESPVFPKTLSVADFVAADMATLRVTETILQNVEVLAVAQTVEEILPPASGQEAKAPASGEGEEVEAPTGAPVGREEGEAVRRNPGPNPAAATFTLAVTPEQAQLLFTAEQSGTLRLALRPFSEPQEEPPPPDILIIQ